jgi:hypothetical protein
MLHAARKWQAIALKWRDLADRRSAQHIELFQTGRWTHYYSDEKFLTEMRTAIMLARRWAAICPTADRKDRLAEIEERLELALASKARLAAAA